MWPVTCGSSKVVKMEHTLENRPDFIGTWDEKDKDWAIVKDEYQKLTIQLLDAKSDTRLIVHAIRKPPCVRGSTMIIIY